jgi:hypothetical protein
MLRKAITGSCTSHADASNLPTLSFSSDPLSRASACNGSVVVVVVAAAQGVHQKSTILHRSLDTPEREYTAVPCTVFSKSPSEDWGKQQLYTEQAFSSVRRCKDFWQVPDDPRYEEISVSSKQNQFVLR